MKRHIETMFWAWVVVISLLCLNSYLDGDSIAEERAAALHKKDAMAAARAEADKAKRDLFALEREAHKLLDLGRIR